MPENLFKTIRELTKDTFKSAGQHDITLHGAAIAFYTIFSAAPLIILAISLVNLFLGEQQTMNVISNYLAELAGQDIASTLVEISKKSRIETSGFFTSLTATAILLFAATTVITQLKNSLNTIWGITQPRINSFLQYVVNRVMSLLLILGLTLLFLSSLLLEGLLTYFSDFIVNSVSEGFIPILQIGSIVLSILLTVIFFTIIFNVLPDVNAHWRDVFIGALVTSILFLIGKYVIGFYLGNSSMQPLYKAAGSFIIFMIWIYYNVQIVLLGAEFTQVYIKRFGRNIRPSWNAEIIAHE